MSIIKLENDALNTHKQTKLTIDNNITRYKEGNTWQQKRINEINAEINTCSSQIANIDKAVKDSSELEKQVDVKNKVDALNACKTAWDGTSKSLDDAKIKLDAAQKALDFVENDKRPASIYKEHYDEQTVYGTVMKGDEKRRLFKFPPAGSTNNIPILSVEKMVDSSLRYYIANFGLLMKYLK